MFLSTNKDFSVYTAYLGRPCMPHALLGPGGGINNGHGAGSPNGNLVFGFHSVVLDMRSCALPLHLKAHRAHRCKAPMETWDFHSIGPAWLWPFPSGHMPMHSP